MSSFLSLLNFRFISAGKSLKLEATTANGVAILDYCWLNMIYVPFQLAMIKSVMLYFICRFSVIFILFPTVTSTSVKRIQFSLIDFLRNVTISYATLLQ